MTEQELRNTLTELMADKSRRAEDIKRSTQISTLASVAAIIVVLVGFMSWMGEARVGQIIRPMQDDILIGKEINKAQDASIQTIHKGIDEIKVLIREKK